MSTILGYYSSLIIILISFKLFESKNCTGEIRLKHSSILDCEDINGIEYVNVLCDIGYEFEADVYIKQFDVYDTIDVIQCNGRISILNRYIFKKKTFMLLNEFK